MGNLERGDIFLIISGLASLQPDLGSVSLLLPSHTSISSGFSGQTPSLMRPVKNDNHLQVQLWERFSLTIGLYLKMLIIKCKEPLLPTLFWLFWGVNSLKKYQLWGVVCLPAGITG